MANRGAPVLGQGPLGSVVIISTPFLLCVTAWLTTAMNLTLELSGRFASSVYASSTAAQHTAELSQATLCQGLGGFRLCPPVGVVRLVVFVLGHELGDRGQRQLRASLRVNGAFGAGSRVTEPGLLMDWRTSTVGQCP